MTRQHCVPVLLRQSAPSVSLERFEEGFGLEAYLRDLIQEHPGLLPTAEVDPSVINPVPICTELRTPAGSIDNLLVTSSGLPVLVECKLWRNPEARREVVGQIIDYAKELSRWSSSDLQRAVSERLRRAGNPVLDLVRAVDQTVDEIAFNDALTANLRRGRVLLLIVGDGIREGVEAIAEYLSAHTSLHFALGLVEMPVFGLPDGSRLVVPRVLAKTRVLVREVVALPEGYQLREQEAATQEVEVDPEREARGQALRSFWAEFLTHLRLDDPEQPRPRPAAMGYISLSMPAPGGSCWLTVYHEKSRREMGILVSTHRNTPGEQAVKSVIQDWEAVRAELGGAARLGTDRYGRTRIVESRVVEALDSAEARSQAFAWLAERVNAFVNVLRPRIRSALADV